MSIIRAFLDLLFPTRCIGCGKSDEYICLECIAHFPEPHANLPKDVTALYSYQHPLVKRSLWMLKYHSKKGLAENLGKVLYAEMLEEYIDQKEFHNFTAPVLVPAPLSRKRLRERGFNQSEVLARNILKNDTDKLFSIDTHLVEKIVNTKNQASIHNRSLRLRNLSGAFRVPDPARVRGKNIILIDDVTTTGATLSELKKILKDAGARKIIAFTVAH